jgi:phage gpG-like protein
MPDSSGYAAASNRGGWITLKFNFAGQDQMIRSIQNLGDALHNFRNALEECSEDFYREMKEVFESEGQSIGKPWAPLNREYQKRKEELYGANKGILVRTGALKKSLTDRHDSNAICEVGNTTLKLGSKVKTEDGRIQLVILHQYGWDKPEIVPDRAHALKWGANSSPIYAKSSKAVRVGPRPLMVMTQEMKSRWMEIFKKHMVLKLQEISTVTPQQQMEASRGRSSNTQNQRRSQ